ncbi:MAG: class I SAM-dependent methyltransferase, partial [Gemmatimonadaceae bacterium]|nr:class I SAM-dependent methyltransferase [Acetobacteraceae bacterium]
PGDPRWAAMARLVDGRSDTLDRLAAEVRETSVNHDGSGDDGPARIAAFFDRAVAHSAEASVALYSLGDPAILEAATNEIVGWLVSHRLLHPAADVLDLGCGIGRVAAAMAPHCRSVLGLDVSGGMVAEARRRYARLRFEQTDGRGLDAMPDGAFDLMLVVDAMPYIVQGGVALVDAHFAGAARVLRAGGALVVLNFSYRGDRDADRADAAGLADRHGFTVEQAGATPFGVWDGAAYVFRR